MGARGLHRLLLPAVIGLAAAFTLSSSAFGQAGSDEARGAQILRSVQNGETTCGQLSGGDFELAGEAWMEQTLGSAQAHEAMNRLMTSMMGSSGEEQMHQYMGRRATGCGGGSVPSGFGRMMNMMGLVGGAGGAVGGGGMMGGIGSMMGGFSSSSQGDDDNDVSGWAVGATVALMALFLAGAYFVVRGLRGRPAATGPVEILQRRLAAGEISQDDYDRRLELLGDRK